MFDYDEIASRINGAGTPLHPKVLEELGSLGLQFKEVGHLDSFLPEVEAGLSSCGIPNQVSIGGRDYHGFRLCVIVQANDSVKRVLPVLKVLRGLGFERVNHEKNDIYGSLTWRYRRTRPGLDHADKVKVEITLRQVSDGDQDLQPTNGSTCRWVQDGFQEYKYPKYKLVCDPGVADAETSHA